MSLKKRDFRGATVVLTGAAGGMGEQMALQLAEEGAGLLVLVDRDGERLADLAERLRAGGSPLGVETHVVDLSDREAAVALGARLATDHTRVDLLVNNAGVALLGRFDEVALEDVEWVLDINLRAPIILTHALLPSLKAAPGSQIVNLSSLFGLITPGGQAAYSASKFGLRGFSEVLGVELADSEVGVTTVHPGGIATGIATSARVGSGMAGTAVEQTQRYAEKLLRMDPAAAARTILDGARNRRARVLVGLDAQLLDLLPRLVPGQLRWVMRHLGP